MFKYDYLNEWPTGGTGYDDEHSCSPEECPTCTLDNDCPNAYKDFIEEDEFSI